MPSHGNPPRSVLHEDVLQTPTKLYYGVRACSNGGCHDNPTQKDILLCKYDEVCIWTKQDKHRNANKVLKNERSQRMANLLGIKGDISHEPRCVSCHGVLIKDETLIHKPSFSLEEGVSCGVCHGFNKEWVAKHSNFLDRDYWRSQKPHVKEVQFGMTNLQDPEKNVTLCVSCHIGNTAEAKVVTHTMYAAGHPPLPGFEMSTFSDAMPRHWKYLAEKTPEAQKISNHDRANMGFERTQLVVVAGLVSLRESMNLLASQAKEKTPAKDPENAWPELAQFDCCACHHDLKTKSWRQKRGYAGLPGRPQMREWPLALVHLGILHAAQGDLHREKALATDIKNKLTDLSVAFDAQPFGDPKMVTKAAQELSQSADNVLKKITTIRFDRGTAQRLLVGLGRESKGRLHDFDSARQLAWAFHAIQYELDPGYLADANIAKLFGTLNDQLKLQLPEGQVEVAKDYFKDALEKQISFDPERFNTNFEQLVKRQAK